MDMHEFYKEFNELFDCRLEKVFRYNTWVTNKKQEKVLLWYNLIGQTTIERRTNSCARIIPQKLTIVNVCLSMEFTSLNRTQSLISVYIDISTRP